MSTKPQKQKKTVTKAQQSRTTRTGGQNPMKKKKPVIRANKQELAYRVPECVRHFIHALADPFSAPAGACLPCDLFPLPSSKHKVFTRSRMQLGTAGIGYACITPTASNDNALVQTTTVSSVLPTSAALNTATNLQNISCGQSPYSSAQFAALSVAARMVAFGIRAKYVGQLMDRNGVITAFEDPDHQDARRFSYDQLNSNPYSSIHRVGGEDWDAEVCSSGPVTPQETEFLNSVYPINASTAPLVLAISGVPGDIYEVEAYCHYELIGLLVSNKTKSHAEPTFFGKVIESAKAITDSGPLSPSKGPSLWERFVSTIQEGLPQIVSTVGNAIAPGVGNVLGLVTKTLAGPPASSVFHQSNTNHYGMMGNRMMIGN